MPRSKVLNEQMREESRKKILSTAARLFSQQGFFTIRIAEIASEAGMSPGNIYWYFESKEEILKALLQSVFDRVEQILVEAETWPGSGLEKLNHLIDLELDYLQEHGDFFQIYMSILGHGGDAFLKDLGFDTVQIGLGYHQHLAKLLNEAIQDGAIPPLDPNVLSMFFFSIFNGMLVTYGQDWQQVPPAIIHQAVLRLLGAGGEAPPA